MVVGLARRFLAPTAVVLAGLSSCGTPDSRDTGGSITVFAASSLTGAFTDIGEEFASARPDIDVNFNFAGSTELSTQIIEGAPADVLATADTDSMANLVDSLDDGPASRARVFARNVMEIAVAAGNPEAILGLADLERDGLVTVMCDVTVPCGRYARIIIDRAGLSVTASSLEANVKAVLTKVALGEADAGLVYATDVVGGGTDVEGVAIPDRDNVVGEYPIVALTGSAAARDFVEFVMSAVGQEILVRHGFRRSGP